MRQSFVSVENVMLTKCKYAIRGHLSSCHLSWEINLSQGWIVYLFDIPESTGGDGGLPSSRIGEGMASSSFVSVSNSSIQNKKVKGSHVVQLKLAKEIHKIGL